MTFLGGEATLFTFVIASPKGAAICPSVAWPQDCFVTAFLAMTFLGAGPRITGHTQKS
jgi:hypothetical protein